MTPDPRDTSARSDAGTCPDAELLALYIDGQCPGERIHDVEQHLTECEACYFSFIESVRMTHPEMRREGDRRPLSRKWMGRWFAIALTAAAVALLVVSIERRVADRSSRGLQAALVDLDHASRPYRFFDARVSSMSTYRPVQALVRSDANAPHLSPALQAAADRVRAVANPQDAAGQRALGVMYLTVGDAGRAVAALQGLANSSDPDVMNDVAAAWLARADEGDDGRAAGLLKRAVASERGRPEIWFNLALAAGTTGDPVLARTAWNEAISLEPGSSWADEARRRLERSRR